MALNLVTFLVDLSHLNSVSDTKFPKKATPQQASEMQCPLLTAAFTRKVNNDNSVCDAITFVAYFTTVIQSQSINKSLTNETY